MRLANGRAAAARVLLTSTRVVCGELRTTLRRGRSAWLSRWFGRRRRSLEDSVFFYVDLGLRAADSALALHHELLRRDVALTLYWGVVGPSVAVPHGAISVIKDSVAWYEKVNASRYLVNNYGGILGLRKHPEQRVLQTWHGTPFKFVGRSELLRRGASTPQFATLSKEVSEWDAFISPSPYMSARIRQEWGFTGPILETGYPRNDKLALDEPRLRQALRSDFDLPADACVVLYAPTFREHQRKGWSADLFDGLDVDDLSSRLGPEYCILVRGHSFIARKGLSRDDADRIRNVTDHPDVNDLYLVADVLVTDYSSAMFDFAVTGKPIVYFTPDLAEYSATRGVYFDLAECAPGPLYSDIDSLVDGLADLPALVERYRDRYAAFRERFVPWDDGHAAARVVDAFFAQPHRRAQPSGGSNNGQR